MTATHNADDPTQEPKRPTGLGWAEFFQWLGQGTVAADRRGPLPKPIPE